MQNLEVQNIGLVEPTPIISLKWILPPHRRLARIAPSKLPKIGCPTAIRAAPLCRAAETTDLRVASIPPPSLLVVVVEGGMVTVLK
jgi:hypothetical protein